MIKTKNISKNILLENQHEDGIIRLEASLTHHLEGAMCIFVAWISNSRFVCSSDSQKMVFFRVVDFQNPNKAGGVIREFDIQLPNAGGEDASPGFSWLEFSCDKSFGLCSGYSSPHVFALRKKQNCKNQTSITSASSSSSSSSSSSATAAVVPDYEFADHLVFDANKHGRIHSDDAIGCSLFDLGSDTSLVLSAIGRDATLTIFLVDRETLKFNGTVSEHSDHDGQIQMLRFDHHHQQQQGPRNMNSSYYSSDNNKCCRLLTASDDASICVYKIQGFDGFSKTSVTSTKLLHRTKAHSSWLWSCDQSFDGLVLASGASDNTIFFYDNTGLTLSSYEKHTDSIYSLDFAQTRRSRHLCLSGSRDHTAHIIDISNLPPVRRKREGQLKGEGGGREKAELEAKTVAIISIKHNHIGVECRAVRFSPSADLICLHDVNGNFCLFSNPIRNSFEARKIVLFARLKGKSLLSKLFASDWAVMVTSGLFL